MPKGHQTLSRTFERCLHARCASNYWPAGFWRSWRFCQCVGHENEAPDQRAGRTSRHGLKFEMFCNGSSNNLCIARQNHQAVGLEGVSLDGRAHQPQEKRALRWVAPDEATFHELLNKLNQTVGTTQWGFLPEFWSYFLFYDNFVNYFCCQEENIL